MTLQGRPSARARLHHMFTLLLGGVVLVALAPSSGAQAVEDPAGGGDCPEKRQAFGNRAKQFTSKLVFGKTVTVQVLGRDRYGRTVGVVLLPDGRSLNHELVRAGLAWWYRRYAPDDETLAQLERDARGAERGLWADAEPVPPWEWRIMRKRCR